VEKRNGVNSYVIGKIESLEKVKLLFEVNVVGKVE
jgi:hypothetical protein